MYLIGITFPSVDAALNQRNGREKVLTDFYPSPDGIKVRFEEPHSSFYRNVLVLKPTYF